MHILINFLSLTSFFVTFILHLWLNRMERKRLSPYSSVSKHLGVSAERVGYFFGWIQTQWTVVLVVDEYHSFLGHRHFSIVAVIGTYRRKQTFQSLSNYCFSMQVIISLCVFLTIDRYLYVTRYTTRDRNKFSMFGIRLWLIKTICIRHENLPLLSPLREGRILIFVYADEVILNFRTKQ